MEQGRLAGACGCSVASYSAGVAKRSILSARRPPAQRAELCLHYLGLFAEEGSRPAGADFWRKFACGRDKVFPLHNGSDISAMFEISVPISLGPP